MFLLKSDGATAGLFRAAMRSQTLPWIGAPLTSRNKCDETPSPLFLAVEKINWLVRDEKRLLNNLGLTGRVSWDYFDPTWTYDSLKIALFGLASAHTNFYVGITNSIVWRWSEGHRVPNDGFIAHKHRWTGMAVLAVDNGLSVVEEMLLTDIGADPLLGTKCHNKYSHGPGPLPIEQRVFLYMCFDRL